MKLPGYILAFYLLILSSVPCCAVDNCPDDKMDLPAGAEQSSNHDSSDEDCGNCSPFFSCEGCASVAIVCQPVQFEIIFFKGLTDYALFIQQSLPGLEYGFWQPPKQG